MNEPKQSTDQQSSPAEVLVEEEQAGKRLDLFLAEQLDAPSRSRLKALIKEGAVSRDGRTIEDPSYKVKPGEAYVVDIPPPEPATPKPENIPLDVVFEDEHLIVINKPAGLVVHPAAGNWNGTLVNALLHHCGESLSGIGGVIRPGIVHRLDKDTSGVMVVAKNDKAHVGLSAQFSDHSIERAYKAIVWGAPRPLLGTVDQYLARSTGDRQKIVVVKGATSVGARRAVTHYKVIDKYGDEGDPAACLVECRLETGRTHQIRVHMSHIGHPVVGDQAYGRGRQFLSKRASKGHPEAKEVVKSFQRQALHAYLLGFIHPITSENCRFEVDMPADLTNLSQNLELL